MSRHVTPLDARSSCLPLVWGLLLAGATGCGKSVTAREVVAPGPVYLALASSGSELFGLNGDGSLTRVRSASVADAGQLTSAFLFTDLLAAAPDQQTVFSIYGFKLRAWDTRSERPFAHQVHDLHTTDLEYVDGRLLTLDCSHISEDGPDGGRTPLLDIDSCYAAYAFAARGPWLLHEMNGVLTVSHRGWKRSFAAPVNNCVNFALTATHAWCTRGDPLSDAGFGWQVVRIALPASTEETVGKPEIRDAFAWTPGGFVANETIAAWSASTNVVVDDGVKQRRFSEPGLIIGLAFEPDGNLVYSVPGAGVVRLRSP